MKSALLQLSGIAVRIEKWVDRLHAWLFNRIEETETAVRIVPYLGYSTPAYLIISARVLRPQSIRVADSGDRIWHNVWRTFQWMNSQEVPGLEIEAISGEQSYTGVSTEEGYVKIQIPHAAEHEQEQKHLIPIQVKGRPETRTHAAVVQPSSRADFGVISDIDDTIIDSRATNYPAAAWLMFTRNARTRTPFDEVAKFYLQLRATDRNPIFYVSSSPWNLYTLLTEFMTYNHIPIGPLFLQDYGIGKNKLIIGGHKGHKKSTIETIFNANPNLAFVLIGDSGQKDTEIYTDLARTYPGRIRAIIIRDVTGNERDEAVVEQLERLSTPTCYAADSAEGIAFAQSIGLIS